MGKLCMHSSNPSCVDFTASAFSPTWSWCPLSPAAWSDDRFHYPPELLSQLVDTIPLLCKSKKDLLLFFRGAGMTPTMMAEVEEIVDADRGALHKYEIARRLLTRFNGVSD